MPVRHVLVRDTGRDVEHDNATLALDIVSIAETTELLLAGGIPDVEADRAKVGGERERVDLDTKRGCERTTEARVSKGGSDMRRHACLSDVQR